MHKEVISRLSYVYIIITSTDQTLAQPYKLRFKDLRNRSTSEQLTCTPDDYIDKGLDERPHTGHTASHLNGTFCALDEQPTAPSPFSNRWYFLFLYGGDAGAHPETSLSLTHLSNFLFWLPSCTTTLGSVNLIIVILRYTGGTCY